MDVMLGGGIALIENFGVRHSAILIGCSKDEVP
jgi:hypothetical protein